jgi:hypothetical protein
MVKMENILESGPTTSTCFAKTVVFLNSAPVEVIKAKSPMLATLLPISASES